MIKISDKTTCCGCTACYNICPSSCITMQLDNEGFFYPVIDRGKCINCDLCEKICPMLDRKIISDDPKAFVVQHKDSQILYESASGGAFSAIASVIISAGGIAYGAVYTPDFSVQHTHAENISDISKFSSSKYVQSELHDIFKDIRKHLLNGKIICFSGTPCQVSGLKKFLRKEYENLITVDLVCKGVASPEVLRQYVKLMSQKYNSKIIGMNFKRKTYGYHSSTMSIDFQNGKKYSRGGITDLMMRSFRANICLRPSCSKCVFKGKSRYSDITIFDCWHYKELTGEEDNNKGHTAVLVHSKKGMRIIDKCKKFLTIKNINLDKAILLDGMMIENCVKEHPLRNIFMKELEKNGIEKAVKKCIPIKFMDHVKEESKDILYFLGLLDTVKKLQGDIK